MNTTVEPNRTNPNPTSNQQIQGRVVTILRTKTGMRVAHVTEHGVDSIIPVELLPLCSGKDAWMREIRVKCAACRKVIVAREMECGELCQECFEAAGEENARLDAGEK